MHGLDLRDPVLFQGRPYVVVGFPNPYDVRIMDDEGNRLTVHHLCVTLY